MSITAVIGWSVGRLTSPSLDSSRSSFLQMAWMSPASARIWIPLGASIRRERVGDSSLPKHNHSNHNNNVNNGRGSPCWPPELQRIIVVEMSLFLHFSSSLVRIQRPMWLWCCCLLMRPLVRLFVHHTVVWQIFIFYFSPAAGSQPITRLPPLFHFLFKPAEM